MSASCSLILRVGFAALLFAGVAMEAAEAGSLVPIYTFSGADGSQPLNLAFGVKKDHSLYGVVQYGGAHNLGAVFKLTPPSKGPTWSETLLYSFTGGQDGANPQGIIVDEDGTIFGATLNGGGSINCGQGCGTVFELTPPAHPSGTWTETVLHRFVGNDDGKWLFGAPTLHKGDLYGATQYGGGLVPYSEGAVFRLKRPKSAKGIWKETILHSFVGEDLGYGLKTGVVFSGKNIYGTTIDGGPTGWGTVYELSPSHGGTKWTWMLAKNFDGVHDGATGPNAPLMVRNGVVYGTGQESGHQLDYGAVFSLTPAGNNKWDYSIVHLFTGGTDGSVPDPLAFAPNGTSLYVGVHQGGGITGDGAIYELTAPGKNSSVWGKSTLWNFTGGTDGIGPQCLVVGSDGAIYGASLLGPNGDGVIFKLTP